MPKALRLVVLVLILVFFAGIGYVVLRNNTDEPSVPTTANTQVDASSQPTTVQTTAAGSYSDYEAETVANTKGQRILYFHAPWCPQCRKLEASIKAGAIPSGVTIFKVDYDSNQKLRQQYGVTIQTTLILLDENGNEAKKYVAYDQPSLEALIKNLL